ncbi:hypothetical protein DSH70_16010, partial [Enterococcus faecalis]|nr:hypothetical protein [Enterococcus faecalis]
MSKNIWKIIIVFTSITFIYSLLTKQIWITVLVLMVSLQVSKQNIFEEYDKKQAEKRRMFRNMLIEHRNKLE